MNACNSSPSPSSGNPCQECPFRKSNAGREHTSGNYDDQFILDWRGIAKGGFFACHVFAPDIHQHDEATKAMGYVTPVETGSRPECAGSTLAILRELALARAYGDYAEYIKARPAGLSLTAIKTLIARIKGEAEPALNVPENFPLELVRDPQTDADTTSPYWIFGAASVERIFNVMGEPKSYEAMHPATSLKLADGTHAEVDAKIRPLLAALSNTGVQTINSCQNFREVLDARFPHRLAVLLDPQEFEVHYKTAMETGGAYVRFMLTTPAAHQFIKTAADVPGVTTQQAVDVAQVDFPLTRLLRLTELAAAQGRARK